MKIHTVEVRQGMPIVEGRFAEFDFDDIVDMSASIRGSNSVNAMSVDVEEYFQVSAFEHVLDRKSWNDIPGRLEQNIDKILNLFDKTNTKATFFTLGWVAERMPKVVRAIVSEGHELASHGYDHRRVWAQGPEKFRDDVSRTKKTLEDVSGHAVIGYRAPSFSIDRKSIWAHDILKEAGYLYSSSIYPVNHDHYGMPSAPRFPFRTRKNGIVEIPLTTTVLAGRTLPGAGGGYFRLMPLTYFQWVISRVNRHDNMPAIFYFHPWELDPDQPRVANTSLTTRFRHYVNLKTFESKLRQVLRKFHWGRVDKVFADILTIN